MSKVLVLELGDDADLTEVMLAIRVTARAFAAIGEDAAKVLAAFAPPEEPDLEQAQENP